MILNCIGKTEELTSPGRDVSVMTEQGLGLRRRSAKTHTSPVTRAIIYNDPRLSSSHCATHPNVLKMSASRSGASLTSADSWGNPNYRQHP